MARPTEDENADRRAVHEQIEIGLRAYDLARKNTDPDSRCALFDFAVSHVATAAAKIENQKRKVHG